MSVSAGQQMAVETAERRAAQRARAAERRDREEVDYRDELADAIVAYLDFADELTELARRSPKTRPPPPPTLAQDGSAGPGP